MRRALGLVAWSLVWPVAVLFATGFAMMGDPVEGGYEQQQLLGRAMLLGGAIIFVFGYWLLLRRQKQS